MDFDPYDWYQVGEVAQTKLGATGKTDYRMISQTFGELICRCSAHLTDNNHEQNRCKWYIKSKYRDCCMYDRWGIMCDKLVVDEKEVN